jgi:hypothetical protein
MHQSKCINQNASIKMHQSKCINQNASSARNSCPVLRFALLYLLPVKKTRQIYPRKLALEEGTVAIECH